MDGSKFDTGWGTGRGKAVGTPYSAADGTPRVVPAGGQKSAGMAAGILNALCREAQISSITEKVDRAVELAARYAARRSVLPLEGADTTLLPSVGEAAQQFRSEHEARAARMCAESEAAYSARNPHKRGDQR